MIEADTTSSPAFFMVTEYARAFAVDTSMPTGHSDMVYGWAIGLAEALTRH